MLKKTLLATAILATLTACNSTTTPQSDVANIAANLDVQYTITKGALPGDECKALGADWSLCNAVDMTLTNTGEPITGKDWTIYFHSIRMILDVKNDQFKITQVTGDLHKLEPTEKFEGFAKDQKVIVPIVGEYWQLFETDFLPGAFVTAEDVEPRAIESLKDGESFVTEFAADLYKRVPTDSNILATANSRFEKNADVQHVDVTANLIPTPNKVHLRTAKVDLSKGLQINAPGLSDGHIAAINKRATFLGLSTTGSYTVDVKIDSKAFKKGVSGQYKADIASYGMKVVAFDQAAAFYAMQSLFALVSLDSKVVPSVLIEDAPRFDYRGIMVDVARNFHSKEAILATVDQMAAYKMNKLHLHLTDDEGWRLEIPGLPELTDVGGKRCLDMTETTCLLPQLGSGFSSDNNGSGFFTKADYIEIVKYAKARSIEVIPEIDMPAHSRAAVVSMEARYTKLSEAGDMKGAEEYRLMDPKDESNVTTIQFYDKHSFINPCMQSSAHFVDKVITEIAKMYEEAGVPLQTWQFGGDEAKNIKLGGGYKGAVDQTKEDLPFAKSPICQQLIKDGKVATIEELPGFFAEKVSGIVAKHNIPHFQAWEDGLKHSEGAQSFKTETVRANFWETLYWGGAESAYKWAEKGYDMIISNPDYVYMDFPYEVDTKESGYYWATRATDTRKMFAFAPENLPQNAETSLDRDGNGFKSKGSVDGKPFLGLSAQLWSEIVRTDEQYEYMVFPRVIAAAERAWTKASWEVEYKAGVEFSQDTNMVDKKALLTDWTRFANVMGQRELAKIEKSGVDYRLPVPGAIIKGGQLEMNSQFPGIALQYSLDNGTTWMDYTKPVAVTVGELSIRSVSATKARTSRVTMVKVK